VAALAQPEATARPILELKDVRVHFPVSEGVVFKRQVAAVKAVDGVNFRLDEGDVFGLVGESGCGKSTLARAIVRLTPVTGGRIAYDGRDLLALDPAALRHVRREIQLIFQDPYASLNPRMTVYDAIAEPLLVHRLASRAEAPGRVSALMEKVGLAARDVRKYPHEFSGGQRQRIAIARALALGPRLIIADEPVSALDVSIQAQILNLIANLCRDQRLTLVFISHDLSVVRHISNRIAVMYLGKIVEIGPTESVFSNPAHPYTRALLNAIPRPDPKRKRDRTAIALKGDPPSPLDPPSGCAFHPRCVYAVSKCREAVPLLEPARTGQAAACIRLREIGGMRTPDPHP
jgi:oligopeptide transport system ATP-binding protein